MKRLALLILAFVGMHVEARPITEDEKSAVENVIREEMKDDAAKFYHMDFPYPDTTFTYCGYVNGKNSYGAYAGKQLFATFLGKNADGKLIAASFDVNSQTGEPIDQTVISTLCASAGYDIPVKKMFFKDVNKNRAEKHPQIKLSIYEALDNLKIKPLRRFFYLGEHMQEVMTRIELGGVLGKTFGKFIIV
jgi:hypothetical protein